MAGDVAQLKVEQGLEYQPGFGSRDVAIVAVRTQPSNVGFEFRIPRGSFTAELAKTEAEQYAAQVEAIMQVANVASIQWGQDDNGAGYLLDEGTITVRSDSGNSSLSYTVPWGEVNLEAQSPKIDALRNQLNAAERV